MIRGICFTNLDNYNNVAWPTKFVAVPEIGSSVESRGGAILKVVGITHATINRATFTERDDEPNTPIIKIELNRIYQ
jgi:hypothetical protein